MSNLCFYRLAGLASGLGGLLGVTAHALRADQPVDPAQLAQYARINQPLQLILFFAGVLVLLGWFGQFALQSSSSGFLGLVTFLLIFLGILLADLTRSILEFSVFPLLMATVPYATPALAEAIYDSTPFAVLANTGKCFVLLGVPLTAVSIIRTRILPPWCAAPFAITCGLMIAGFLPASARMAQTEFFTAFYFSMAVLGFALLRESFTQAGPTREEQHH